MKNTTYSLENGFDIRIFSRSFEFIMYRNGNPYRGYITIKKLKRVIRKLEKAQLKNNVAELKNQRDKLTEQNRSLKLQLKNKVKKWKS